MKRLLLLLLLLPGLAFAQIDPNLDSLNAYYQQTVTDFELPGMSIAIVKDGKIVFSKGYGMRDVANNKPVTGNTLFNIASCTKAFGAASIGLLAQEGKLSWDDKVVDHLPNFQLEDPWITSELSLRDMLSHRTSLGTFYGDLLWYGTERTEEDIMHRMRYLPITQNFRSEFGYQNNMYMMAGMIVEKVTGQPWAEFVTERFLKPMKMEQTRTGTAGITSNQELALPYTAGKLYPGTHMVPNPAASFFSSTNDLANWMMTLMDSGRYSGQQVLKQPTIDNLWSQHTVIPVSNFSKKIGMHFRGYGLGWFMWDIHGKKVVEHGGGMPGYISKVAMVPEENLGIVILTNDLTSVPSSLLYYTLDAFLAGKNERDWSNIFYNFKVAGEAQEAKTEADHQAARAKKTSPSLDLADFAGTYRDKMYGDASITLDGKELLLKLLPAEAKFTATMEHWHYDTFRIQLKDAFITPGFVNFTFDSAHKVDGFTIDLPHPDFHFFNLDFKRVK